MLTENQKSDTCPEAISESANKGELSPASTHPICAK